MHPPIRAVAFDFDGLMFNTEQVYDKVGVTLLARRNKQLEPSVIARMMGRPGLVALQIMVDAYGLSDTAEELELESQLLYHELIGDGVRPMPGLMRLLDAVETLGLAKAICTSSRPKMVKPLLETAGISQRFAFLLTAHDVTRHKPDPEIYLTAAERLQVEPSELMVLEDSMVGCQAAVDAGTCAVAVPSKHVDQHDFSGAAFVASSLADSQIYRRLGIA